MLIKILALSLLAPLALLAACSGDDNATSTPKPAGATTAGGAATTAAAGTTKDITITAADFSLTPATITVAAGQKVKITLKNNGAVEHSFTVGSTDVTEAEGGAESSGEFTAASGNTEFHCKYHSTQMKGTITISGASSQNLPSATAASGISGGYGY